RALALEVGLALAAREQHRYGLRLPRFRNRQQIALRHAAAGRQRDDILRAGGAHTVQEHEAKQQVPHARIVQRGSKAQSALRPNVVSTTSSPSARTFPVRMTAE